MTDAVRREPVGLDALLAVLGADVVAVLGRRHRLLTHPAPLGAADAHSLSFCSRGASDPLRRVRESQAGVVICDAALPLTPDDHRERTLILVENPRLAFVRAMKQLFRVPPQQGIHPTAVIEPSAAVASPATIGPYCYIASDVRIGPHAHLLAHVVVHSRTTIGARVRINAGAVIGTDGFGYERNADGEFERFEQIGGVVIEDDVDVGAHVVINRGTLGNTMIGSGTKISNLVNLGHNTIIGRNVFIAPGCIVAGSARVGHGSWLASGAMILDGVVVGNNALVTMGSVVVRDVPDGARIAGVPGRQVPAASIQQ